MQQTKNANVRYNGVTKMCVTQKSYSSAAEGKAILGKRTEDTAEKLKMGQFVAAWSDEKPGFVVLKIAKPPRKAKRDEVINGQPTNHGQYMTVEVEWGERKKGTRVDEYDFDTTMPLCSG